MTKKNNETKTNKIPKKVQITLIIPAEASQQIDKIVIKIPNMTKNQFMANLLLIGLDDVKLLDSVGLIAGIAYIRTMMEHAVELFKEGSKQDGIPFKN